MIRAVSFIPVLPSLLFFEVLIRVIDIPLMSKSRDHGELQDMYRRTLAASWAAHPVELPADQCVEDIFNGGDGWKHDMSTPQITGQEGNANDRKGGHQRGHSHHYRTTSGTSITSQNSQNTLAAAGTRNSSLPKFGHKREKSQETIAMSGSPLAATGNESSSEGLSERGRTGMKRPEELDEFAIREDLVAWKLPESQPEMVSF